MPLYTLYSRNQIEALIKNAQSGSKLECLTSKKRCVYPTYHHILDLIFFI